MEMTFEQVQMTVGALYLQNSMLSQRIAQLETELKKSKETEESTNKKG